MAFPPPPPPPPVFSDPELPGKSVPLVLPPFPPPTLPPAPPPAPPPPPPPPPLKYIPVVLLSTNVIDGPLEPAPLVEPLPPLPPFPPVPPPPNPCAEGFPSNPFSPGSAVKLLNTEL